MKKVLIALASIVGIVVLIAIIVTVTGPDELPNGADPTTPEANDGATATSSISRIGELATYTEGAGLTVWFNLLDRDGKQVSAKGDMEFAIYSSGDRVVYEQKAAVGKSDFNRVQRLLGGQELLVYSWFIPFDDIDRYVSDYGRAKLVFAPTGQSPLPPVETTYVAIPKLTDQEIIQLYESHFLQAARTIDKTVTKGSFAITLARVGLFTHLEYETWGDEVIGLRTDLLVQNVGTEKDSIWHHDAVILDNLGNQYDVEWQGTLTLGELHAGVRRQGYLLFPVPDKDATQLRLILRQWAYPTDITYEFVFQTP